MSRTFRNESNLLECNSNELIEGHWYCKYCGDIVPDVDTLCPRFVCATKRDAVSYETKIELFGYQENKFMCNMPFPRGWGNGYVLIPNGHPFLVRLELYPEADYDVFQGCFNQEITFGEWNEHNTFYKLGFDTQHSWHNSSYDEAYVLEETQKMKSVVDSFTKAHACALIEDERNQMNAKLNRIKHLYM